MGEQLLSLAEGWPWAASVIHSLKRPTTQESCLSEWHHSVVFGALAAATPCSPGEAAGVYLHQATLGLISAGVRGIPIGHSHGQQVVARLQATLQSLSEALADRELEAAGSTCPAYEVLCHAQSQLYTRLFRS